MVALKRSKMPRAFLILCEGKTEEAYFNILFDVYRPPQYVEVEVLGQKGQHIALVDSVVVRHREVICDEDQYQKEEVECWVVCDEDKMSVSFSGLERYAEERGVNLALSAPQFEMYLLQHFVQSGSADKDDVFQQLSKYRKQYGGEGDYDDSTKYDLSWLSAAIDRRPKIVATAITNSDLRTRTSKRPFLTVQNLTQRIKEMAL